MEIKGFNSESMRGRQLLARVVAARLAVRIDNYELISCCYGAAAGVVVLEHVRQRITAFFPQGALLLDDGAGQFVIVTDGVARDLSKPAKPAKPAKSSKFWRFADDNSDEAFGPDEAFKNAAADFVYRLQMVPVLVPYGARGTCRPVHLVVGGAWMPALDGVAGVVPVTGPVTGRWAARYRSDMAVAARLLAAMRGTTQRTIGADRLDLDWLEIHHGESPELLNDESARDETRSNRRRISSAPMIFELVPFRVDKRQRHHDLTEDRSAIERIGLSCLFDSFLVSLIVEELHHRADLVLGVTIDAASVVGEGIVWQSVWERVLTRLQGQALLARRLIVSLTNIDAVRDRARTTQLDAHDESLTCVHLFLNLLQEFGCLTALDINEELEVNKKYISTQSHKFLNNKKHSLTCN